MTYISTQQKKEGAAPKMDAEEMRKGLLEISPNNSGKISKDELFKIITGTGNKFSFTEANQVLSLLPKDDGWIDIEALCQLLFAGNVNA